MPYFSKVFCGNNYILTKRFFQNLHFQKNKIVPSVQYASQKSNSSSESGKNSVLVYSAPLKTRVKIVKYISLSSSMIGFAVFPTVMYDLSKLNILLAGAAGTVSVFFLSTPFMLNWITKRYVLELYFDNETKVFTAKIFNIINQIKEIKFKAADVTVPELPGMLSSFSVNGKPLFVDANMIQDPDAYSHMMGYDKPFDITLNISEQNENKKTV